MEFWSRVTLINNNRMISAEIPFLLTALIEILLIIELCNGMFSSDEFNQISCLRSINKVIPFSENFKPLVLVIKPQIKLITGI
tara:strand:- start:255 stop:503 length:249 start_codon:yes stop_codon:yes gene_type:complete